MSLNVITAGPSAGKSSTIRDLSSRGFTTLPEAARILFDQRISEGDSPEVVREEPDFHEQVERVDRRIERQYEPGDATFLDRSLADNLAYRRHFGSPVPDELLDDCEGRYDNVFLLDRIEFKDDEVRSEDDAEAAALHQSIRSAYEDLGYDPIAIPVCPVDERSELILSEL